MLEKGLFVTFGYWLRYLPTYTYHDMWDVHIMKITCLSGCPKSFRLREELPASLADSSSQ